MRASSLPPADRGPCRPGEDWADRAAEDFLGRFGDTIDDRVAEVLPEILGEQQAPRSRRRPDLALAGLGLLAALAASFVLRDSVLAVCMAWISTAMVCLAAARLAGGRR